MCSRWRWEGLNVKIRSNVGYESERTSLTGAREHPLPESLHRSTPTTDEISSPD
jgi:hypothetical protein